VIEEVSAGLLDAAALGRRRQQPDSCSNTLARRVVFSGFAGLSEADPPASKAYDARSLALLAVLPIRVNDQPGMVNSSVVPVGRMIFVGSGNFFDGGGSGVHAFRLPDPRVNVTEDYELRYWSEKWNISHEQFRDAVKQVGSSARRVRPASPTRAPGFVRTASIKGALPVPDFILPELATLVSQPFP
jgi:hypothetical protein